MIYFWLLIVRLLCLMNPNANTTEFDEIAEAIYKNYLDEWEHGPRCPYQMIRPYTKRFSEER